MTETGQKPPERIWLQHDPNDENEPGSMPPSWETGEISWCWERIGQSDVEYVRADLARPAPAEGAVREAAVKLLRETDDLTEAERNHLADVIEGKSTSLFFRCTVSNNDQGFRIGSSPEDPTPAAPVSVEEAATLSPSQVPDVETLRAEMERQGCSRASSLAFAETAYLALRALAQQDRRAALREMQSIREEIEQESGDA